MKREKPASLPGTARLNCCTSQIQPTRSCTHYLSFGSDMDTSRKRGASCYRELRAESGKAIRLHRKRWGTTSGLNITVIQNDTADAVSYDPAQLAELLETLRFDHAHARAGRCCSPHCTVRARLRVIRCVE